MSHSSQQVHIHGECLFQFPNFPLILYRLWSPYGITDFFDKHEFFKKLIGSNAYHHQRLNHSSDEEHGPFARSKIRPENYEHISFEDLVKTLESRLITSPESQYDDPWPSSDKMKKCLEQVLNMIWEDDTLHCYKLMIHLEDEQYWSKSHQEVRILEHFEEWVTINTETGFVYMLQLIRD